MNINQFITEIKNQFSKKQPTHASLKVDINEQSLTRSRQDLSNLKNALMMAESKYHPNRSGLIEVYENIITDAHLSSIIQSRKHKVLSKEFKIVNTVDFKEDKTKTEIFESKWFYDFISYSLDSIFYGFSLIQLGNIIDGKFDISIVDRRHVIPDKSMVVPYPSSLEGVNFNDPKIIDWIVPVGSRLDLGVLLKVADLVLFKKMCLSAFAQFTELFGVPIRVGKVSNTQNKSDMVNMLKNMGSASWGVFDKDDSIEVLQMTGTNGDVFEQFLNYIDKSISKAIAGQTMTSDNGSSKSQAEVHENTFDQIIEADMKMIQFTINDLLIPKMIKHGFKLNGYKFKFDTSEFLSLKDKFEMVDKLQKNGLEVELDFIIDEFGIPVKNKTLQPPIEEDSVNFS